MPNNFVKNDLIAYSAKHNIDYVLRLCKELRESGFETNYEAVNKISDCVYQNKNGTLHIGDNILTIEVDKFGYSIRFVS